MGTATGGQLMTKQHPLTDHEADKYLQMGWDWAIEEIILRWADTVQSDLENGVKCLNERAAQELATKYPSIFAFGEVLESLERMHPQQQENN